MKFELLKSATKAQELFKVQASERQYKFCERRPLSIDLRSRNMFIQKLQYIHTNLIQPHWKLCTFPEEYRYSSANFYEQGMNKFGMLTHYLG